MNVLKIILFNTVLAPFKSAGAHYPDVAIAVYAATVFVLSDVLLTSLLLRGLLALIARDADEMPSILSNRRERVYIVHLSL